MLELNPEEREPFHWQDMRKDRVIKFRINIPYGAPSWSSPFTIDDACSLFVQNKLPKEEGAQYDD